MDSGAGSSVACRRRRLSVVSPFFASLSLCFTWFLFEFLVSLGFLTSFAVASCRRYCRVRLSIMWLLCSPSPALWTAIVPDLMHKTCNYSPPICSSQISDLMLLRRVVPSSSPRTMIFLPLGKIDCHWFWCKGGSRSSPLCSRLAGSMSLNGSDQYYRPIPVSNLSCDDLLTKLYSKGTPSEAEQTDDLSPFLSLLDHIDQRLGFGSVKSPRLHHGNVEVGNFGMESTLVPSKIGFKPFSMSAGVKVKSVLMSDYLWERSFQALIWREQGNIFGTFVLILARLEYFRYSVLNGQSLQAMKSLVFDSQNPLSPPLTQLVMCFRGFLSVFSHVFQRVFVNRYWLELTMCIRCPKLASSILRHCSVSSTNLRLLHLKSNSPLTPSFEDVFMQFSSRQGRERSFSPSSFSKERICPQISLFIRSDSLPVSKTGKNYQLPSRLLSCVKVRLGPVDATILIAIGMRVEVLENIATSHFIVTNRLLLEDFEVRRIPFIDWIASGNFDIFLNFPSNFLKFVSLSLYFIVVYVWDLAVRLAHHGLYGVALTHVIA